MLQKIIEQFDKAEKENYLDLSNIKLKELPEIPNTLNDIIYLFINDNLISNINFSNFLNLKVIDISDNCIETINFLPENLEELVCNNCKLVNICQNSNIERLHCQDNYLENLNYYEKLVDLRCDNNKIKHIQSLPNLKKLSCTNNPIEKIDIQQNLKVLDCSYSNIEGSINFAPVLHSLICHKTKINDVSNLSNIFEIEFFDSHIECLPFLPKLKSIILGNKNILISPDYKIKKYLEYDGKIDIVFE